MVGGQQPGREILYPVATVILGGLITSTFCEFLIHPGLFWRFSGKDAERLGQQEPRRPRALLGFPGELTLGFIIGFSACERTKP